MYLSLAATALQRIVENNRRRLGLTLAFLLLFGVCRALGAPVGDVTLLLLSAWAMMALGVQRLLRRMVSDDKAIRLQTLVSLADIAMLTVSYYAIGGGWWLGGLFYTMLIVSVNASLPRRRALIVSALAAAAFAALLFAAAAGLVQPRSFLGSPSLAGNYTFAATTAAVTAATLVALAWVQQALFRNIQRSEERHRLLLQTAPEMVFTLDERGVALACNATAVEQTGHSYDELLGRPLATFIAPDDLPYVTEQFHAALGGSPRRFECRFIHRSGAARWLGGSTTPIRESGRVTGVLTIVRDITEQKQAETERVRLQEQLAHSEKMQAVGQLVSGVAHELNNPLAAVLAFAEDMLHDEERSASDREALALIHSQAMRARTIVRDLLAFVRKRDERQHQAVTPADLVTSLARSLRPQVERLGCTLSTMAPAGTSTLEVDVSAIEQVCTNLVVNGAQAAGQGGHISLTARVHAQTCELVIEDDGPGIPDTVMPRLFEPFFTTKPTGQGTGLGLAVSLGIIEQHGGTLRAENRDGVIGRGARFVITLPLRSADVAASPAATSGERLAFATPRRLEIVAGQAAAPCALIVDDEETIRCALRRFLERQGWRVEEAEDGAVAWRLLSAPDARYQVVISDMKMPQLSGLELYARISATRPELLDRLILSTGDVASREARESIEHIRCPVLEKPFSLAALAEAVERIRTNGAAARVA